MFDRRKKSLTKTFNEKVLAQSREIRKQALASWDFSIKDISIRNEYNLLPTGPFITLLTLGLNRLKNRQLSKEADARDIKEIATTGTTTAIKLSKDKNLGAMPGGF